MQLNINFISNIRDLYGASGELWLKNLPDLIKGICRKRNLRFLSPMPDLTYHFVALVEVVSTQNPAILKMAPISKNIEAESQWFQCFSKGVPNVYWFDEEYSAFLMERLVPGKALKTLVSTGDDDSATRIICQIIHDLQSHQTGKISSEFKHLSEHRSTLSLLKGRFDDKMLSKAESWFQELTSDRSQDVLLHGDLHHDNILSSVDSWKVIDPHGYVGDPVFEVGAMIYNPGDCFPKERSLIQTIERRLKILAEELSFDPQRIKAWAFCMTVLSIAWSFEDHAQIPEFDVQVASILDKIRI